MKSQLASIPLGRIRPSPYNPRREPGGLEELAASIKAVGIIEPLVVALSRDDPDCVEVVAGSRRFAAAQMAGLKEVPAIVLPAVGERVERTISLVENLHRRDMTHIEQGEAFRDLIRTGLTQEEVSRQTGVSNYTVSVKLTLVRKLIPEFQDLIHRDRMTLREGLDLAKLPQDVQRDALAAGRGSIPRPSSLPPARRSKTEAALMAALSAFRAGLEDLALAEAERAVGFLRNRKKRQLAA